MPPFTDPPEVEALDIKVAPDTHAGDYDIDYVTVEYYPDEDRFDFRLQLGLGLGIYWALPEEPNGSMWLAHVDGAAYTVDEPELVDDPWSADVDLVFEGALGRLGGAEIVAVRVSMTAEPMSYRCEIVAKSEGNERVEVLSWRGEAP